MANNDDSNEHKDSHGRDEGDGERSPSLTIAQLVWGLF